MRLLLLGVSPPTDVERRVRELQQRLYRERDLPEAMALPVLIPLQDEEAPGSTIPGRRPAGRLEAPRLVTGEFAVQGRWLLWVSRPEPGLESLAGLWRGVLREDPPGRRAAGRLPLGAGFPLAWSPKAPSLRAALPLLGTEPPRTFQPRALTLYRLSPLGAGRVAAGPGTWQWGRAFSAGIFWEELWSCPLRRPGGRGPG